MCLSIASVSEVKKIPVNFAIKTQDKKLAIKPIIFHL